MKPPRMSDAPLFTSGGYDSPSGDRDQALSNTKNREHHAPEALNRGPTRLRVAARGAQKPTIVLLSSRASDKEVSPLRVAAALGYACGATTADDVAPSMQSNSTHGQRLEIHGAEPVVSQ